MTQSDPDEALRKLREANERLVIAAVNAEISAENSEAARLVARRDEQRLRSLVVDASTIIWRADRDGRVEPEQDGWLAFTGIAIEDLPGDGWLAAVHPDDRDRIRARWRDAIATSTTFTCDHRLRRAGGDYAWVTERAVPIVRDGVVHEWIGMMTDITDRIAHERAREQFVAIVGHDLQSPLASVAISAEALKRLQLPSPYGFLVDEISKIAARMAGLVHDIMDFAHSRLGHGIPIVRRSCDLAVIVEDIVREVRSAHPDRVIAASSTGELVGEWDPGRLGQVVTNLVVNALAHGNGAVDVSLTGLADVIELAVTNHGPAISPAMLDQIFEPFTTSVRMRGLGLGLYIVREIVQRHDGTIRVSSTPDRTIFTVTLPR